MSEAGEIDLLSVLLGGFADDSGGQIGVTIIMSGIQVPISIVTPAALTGATGYGVVSGSEIDASAFLTLSYTFAAASFDADIQVCGANSSDYSDETVVNSSTVTAGSVGSYSTSQAPFLFYRVKAKNHTNGSVSTITVRGAAKR